MTNKPDFKKWAEEVLDRDELVEALEKAYRFGYKDGYMDTMQEPDDA